MENLISTFMTESASLVTMRVERNCLCNLTRPCWLSAHFESKPEFYKEIFIYFF